MARNTEQLLVVHSEDLLDRLTRGRLQREASLAPLPEAGFQRRFGLPEAGGGHRFPFLK